MNLLKNQICPYCGYEVEDAHAEWEEGSHSVECDACDVEYIVEPVYEFKGFEIHKLCATCGEIEEDCYCDLDE
jgi:hypothetical protein